MNSTGKPLSSVLTNPRAEVGCGPEGEEETTQEVVEQYEAERRSPSPPNETDSRTDSGID